MRSALLLILVLTALLLTGCAGGSSAASASAPTPSGEKNLIDQAHVSIDFRAWARERVWATLIVLGASVACIAALVYLMQNKKSFWKWLFILFLVTSWFLLTAAVSEAIRNGWPEGLTREFAQSCRGEGIADRVLDLFSGIGLDWTIRTVTTLLWFTHGVAVFWFFLLVVPVLVENLILGPRFAAAAVGTWFGFAFSRWVTPQVIFWLTKDICDEVQRGGNLLEQAQAALDNFLNMINIKMMLAWGGSFFILLAFFMIFFGYLGFLVAPVVGEVAVKVGREVRSLQREAERQREQEEAHAEREVRRHEAAARQLDRQEVEGRIQEVEQRLETRAAGREEPQRPELPRGWQERGGVVSPQREAPSVRVSGEARDRPVPRFYYCPECGHNFWTSTAPGQSASCWNCSKEIRHEKSYRDEEEWRKKGQGGVPGILAAKTENAASAAEVGGTLATAAGHPEFGVPLTVGGRVARRVAAQRTTPDQDPKVAEEQAAADRSLAEFDSGEEAS